MAINVEGTDYVKLPVGTTAQRPVSPESGMMRFNTTTGFPEWYDIVLGQWVSFNAAPIIPDYTISYLAIAGGAGGGIPGGGDPSGDGSAWRVPCFRIGASAFS